MNELLTPQEIGAQLKEYFRQKGISQQEIADRLGIAQAGVSARFCGLRPFGRNAAKKWSDEFGINRQFLISGIGPVSGDQPCPQPVNQTISQNTGVAINQAGSNGQIQVGAIPTKAKGGEGFFAKLCQDLMQQIIERDERICCLEDEINLLKKK